MDAAAILLIVLLVVATAACGFVIWALFELVKTLRSARSLAEDLDASLVPLLGKADVTVDAVNAELLRIDEIVTVVEEVTNRVSSTSRTVQEVANAPAEIVGEITGRVRKAWTIRRQNREARRQSHATATEEGASSQSGSASAPTE